MQLFIPGNTFHTARITGKRRWFLGASTEWPDVVPTEDVELGNADELAAKYPEARRRHLPSITEAQTISAAAASRNSSSLKFRAGCFSAATRSASP